MKKVYYNPPVGSEPLEFTLNGRTKVFQPADKCWKKKRFEAERPVQWNDKGEAVRFKSIGQENRWVDDEEANAIGTTPVNWHYMTDLEITALRLGRYSPKNQYVEIVEESEEVYRQQVADRKAAHERELAAMKRKMVEVERKAAEELRLSELERARQKKSAEAATAEALGLTLQELQEIAETLKADKKKTKAK